VQGANKLAGLSKLDVKKDDASKANALSSAFQTNVVVSNQDFMGAMDSAPADQQIEFPQVEVQNPD